jgi:hypothetical protein
MIVLDEPRTMHIIRLKCSKCDNNIEVLKITRELCNLALYDAGWRMLKDGHLCNLCMFARRRM